MSPRGKSLSIFLLAGGLLGIGGYACYFGTGTPQVIGYLAFALALVAIYALNGLELPEFAYRYLHVNRDDDPGNLPPTLYLSILLAAILIGGLVVAIWLKR